MTHRQARRKLGSRSTRRRGTKVRGGKAVRPAVRVRQLLKASR